MNPLFSFPLSVSLLRQLSIDVRCRRIPNWLVVPFLAAGLVFAWNTMDWRVWERVLAGSCWPRLHSALCWLRAMGLGDLKLCMAVGAWIGFAQFSLALVVTAVAGGIIGVLWMSRSGRVGEAFDGARELLFSLPRRRFRPHPALTLDNPQANTMPYAPAIAIGALFSFLC